MATQATASILHELYRMYIKELITGIIWIVAAAVFIIACIEFTNGIVEQLSLFCASAVGSMQAATHLSEAYHKKKLWKSQLEKNRARVMNVC